MWMGLGLSPFVSVILVALIVYVRYGREKFPLLLENDTREVYIFDAELNVKNIINLRNQVEQLLIKKQVTHKSVTKIMLFIEEIGMLAYDKNQGKTVSCECGVMIGDDVQVIVRDDGIINDATNPDNRIESLRTYVVARMMLHMPYKRALVTTGYNRTMVRFEK